MTTYYITPGNTFNGDGTSPLPATTNGGVGSYNTWTGVTLTANNIYLQKRNTISRVAIRPTAQTSNITTPLTIGAFFNDDGSDDPTQSIPVIDHLGGSNGTGAIFIDNCTNVLVQDIAGINSQASGGAAIRARATTASQSGLVIRRCVGYNNMSGIHIVTTSTGGPFIYTDILIENNVVHNNRAGIVYQWGNELGNIIKRLVIKKNTVYNNGKILSIQRPGGITYVFDGGAIKLATWGCTDVEISENEVYDNDNYPLQCYLLQNEKWVSNITNNHIHHNNQRGLFDSHSIWLGICTGTIVQDNYIHDNVGFISGSIGTQAGILIDISSDFTTGCEKVIVRRNYIINGWFGPTLSTSPGMGIGLITSNNCLVYSNYICNFRNGLAVVTNSNNNSLYNNTIKDCNFIGIGTGFGYFNTSGTGNILRGNLFYNVLTGIHVDTGAGTTESYNCVYKYNTYSSAGSLLVPTGGASAGTGSVTIDPLITYSGHPKPLSPILKTIPNNLSLYGTTRDGIAYQMPNPMGCYEPLKRN